MTMDITIEDCKLWLLNKLVNPITGRTIKENCITYNKFEKKCIEYKLLVDKFNDLKRKEDITIEDCKLWLSNKLVNPITRRRINENCITYNKFEKKCIEYKLLADNGKYRFNNNDNKKRKTKISKVMRIKVWNTHIGDHIGKTKCYCCEEIDITQSIFECGHIEAEANGGKTEVSNLKPICSTCNKSMGTKNLYEFKKEIK
jgi:hypothetical protein